MRSSKQSAVISKMAALSPRFAFKKCNIFFITHNQTIMLERYVSRPQDDGVGGVDGKAHSCGRTSELQQWQGANGGGGTETAPGRRVLYERGPNVPWLDQLPPLNLLPLHLLVSPIFISITTIIIWANLILQINIYLLIS